MDLSRAVVGLHKADLVVNEIWQEPLDEIWRDDLIGIADEDVLFGDMSGELGSKLSSRMISRVSG